jgi:hypothetical protein
MTNVQTFEYAVKHGLSNNQAKRRMRGSSEEVRFEHVQRGGPVKGTGKRKGAAKK